MRRFTNLITSSPIARGGATSRSLSDAASNTRESGFTEGPPCLAGRCVAAVSMRSRTSAWLKSSAEMATGSASTVGSVRCSSASAAALRGATIATVRREPTSRTGSMRCWRTSLVGIIARTDGCRSKSLSSTKGMLPAKSGAGSASASATTSVRASCGRSVKQMRPSCVASLRSTASATGGTLRSRPTAASFCIQRIRLASSATMVTGLGLPAASGASPNESPGPSVSTSVSPSGNRTVSLPEKTMPRPSQGPPAVTTAAPAGTSTPWSSPAARATTDLSQPLNSSARARNGSIFAGTSFTTSPGGMPARPGASGCGADGPAGAEGWGDFCGASAGAAVSPFVCEESPTSSFPPEERA